VKLSVGSVVKDIGGLIDMNKMCPLVYSGIATDPSGGYRPCCRFDQLHSFHGSLEEYKQSDLWKEIETDFQNNKFHKGCWDCEKNENANGNSKRLREISNYKAKYKKDNIDLEHLKTVGYDLIDLRLSNKCNLGCATCNPKSSSLIHEEVKNAQDHMSHYKNIYKWVQDKNLTKPYTNDDLSNLLDTVKPSSRVYFTGGEPSIVKGVLKFLQSLIDMEFNSTVRIEFNSNFQTGNPKFIELLSHFPNGLMMPSIDAVGIRAEYIRYPSNWQQITNNIELFTKSCPTWEMHFAPTISILNIFYLDELVDYCNKNNYQLRFTNILHSPAYFNITNLPESYKKLAIDKLKSLENKKCIEEPNRDPIGEIEKYIYSKDTDLERLGALRTNLNKLDKVRNISYKNYLPILKEVFKCL